MSRIKKFLLFSTALIACTLFLSAVFQAAFPALGNVVPLTSSASSDADLFQASPSSAFSGSGSDCASPSSASAGSGTASPSSAEYDEDNIPLINDLTSANAPSNSFINAPGTILPPEEKIEITRIRITEDLTKLIRLLELGTPAEELSIKADQNCINFFRENGRFAERDVAFSVIFRTGDFNAAHTDQTGLFLLDAEIMLEDDRYLISPDLSTEFTVPVFLYDEDQPASLPSPVVRDEAMDFFNILAAVHSDLKDVADQLNKKSRNFYLSFENGYSLVTAGQWILDDIDMDSPGIYKAYYAPALPDGVLLKEIPLETCSVNIQDPEIFTLSSPTSVNSLICTEWLYPSPDLAGFRKWYRINDGEWMEYGGDDLMRLRNVYVYTGESPRYLLYLAAPLMDADSVYQFQLDYHGVYSDVLEIRLNGSGFVYRKYEGDRDGGDRGDETLPDITLPDTTLPNPTLPDPTLPDSTLPDPTLPDPTLPDPTAPDGSEPGSVPGESAPEESSPAGPALQESVSPGFPGGGGNGSHGLQHSSPSTGGHSGSGTDQTTKTAAEPANTSVEAAPVNSADALSSSLPAIPAAAPLFEADTADYTIWSGKRITKYREVNPGLPLTFEKHSIRLEIDAGSDAFKNMTDRSMFRADLKALSEDTVYVELSMDGIPLSNVPPLTITMPWYPPIKNAGAEESPAEESPAVLNVIRQDGSYVGPAAYEKASSSITFTLRETGTFTVCETDANSAGLQKQSKENAAAGGRVRSTENSGTAGQTSAEPASRTGSTAAPSKKALPAPLITGLSAVLVVLSGFTVILRRRRKKDK